VRRTQDTGRTKGGRGKEQGNRVGWKTRSRFLVRGIRSGDRGVNDGGPWGEPGLHNASARSGARRVSCFSISPIDNNPGKILF